MKRPTVLILASDPAFSREITAHWSYRNSDPDSGHCEVEFTVLDQDFSSALAGSNYDLAIADGSSEEKKKTSASFNPLTRISSRLWPPPASQPSSFAPAARVTSTVFTARLSSCGASLNLAGANRSSRTRNCAPPSGRVQRPGS